MGVLLSRRFGLPTLRGALINLALFLGSAALLQAATIQGRVFNAADSIYLNGARATVLETGLTRYAAWNRGLIPW